MFVGIFTVELLVYVWLGVKAFVLIREGRNIFNLLMFACVTLFLVDRIAGIVTDLYYTHDSYSFVLIYLFFQLPQNLLEIAIMVFFFSLSEVYLTLQSLDKMRMMSTSHSGVNQSIKVED